MDSLAIMNADGEDTVPRLQQRITDRTGRGGGRSGRGGRGGGRRNSIAFSAPSPSSTGFKPAVHMPAPREATRRRMTMGAKAIPETVDDKIGDGAEADAFDKGELSRLATRKAALDNELNACVATGDLSDPGLQATAARVWAELEEVGATTVKVQAEAVSRRASLTATAAQRRASMPMAAMAEAMSPGTGSSGISNEDDGQVEVDADALLSLHEEAEKAAQVAAEAAAEAAAQAEAAQAAEARAVEARAAELALAHEKAMSTASVETVGAPSPPVEASTTVSMSAEAVGKSTQGTHVPAFALPPAAPAVATVTATTAVEARASADSAAAAELKASLAVAQSQALAAAQAKEKLEAEVAAAAKRSKALEEKLASATAQLQAATQSEAVAVAESAAAKAAAEEAERAVEVATARADAAEAKASAVVVKSTASSTSSTSSITTAITTIDQSSSNDGSSGGENRDDHGNGDSHDLSMLVRVGRGLHAAASSEAMVVGVEHLALLRTVPSCRALSTAQLQVLQLASFG